MAILLGNILEELGIFFGFLCRDGGPSRQFPCDFEHSRLGAPHFLLPVRQIYASFASSASPDVACDWNRVCIESGMPFGEIFDDRTKGDADRAFRFAIPGMLPIKS